MKSLFARNFLIYAMVIVLGFSILGGLFMSQVNRFALEEKQNQVNDALDRAVQNTSTYFELRDRADGDWKDQYFTSYRSALHLLASDCGGTVFVGTAEGDLLFIATPDGCFSQEDNELQLPGPALRELLLRGAYAQTTDFYGYLSDANYVAGTTIGGEDPVGAVFVCVPAQNTAELFLRLSRMFIILTIVVLLLTLVATILVVRSTTKPLQEITGAARRFAQGDLSARAPLPKQQDELYDLTLSFNRMAESM